MSQCPKCGAEIQPGMTFCFQCGTPITNNSNVKSATPQMPQRPQPLMANGPQALQSPQMPQRPQMPQAMQGPQRPQMPTAPVTNTEAADKGFFTDAVRTVANAITGGALNREIERERNAAVSQQARADQNEIQAATRSERDAVQAQIRAEQEAERARDLLSMEAVEGVDVVRGRAIWNIQPGEIARKISERELEEIEKLKGIIVQEGCTAIIFANGQLVSTLSAGAYLFYKSIEEEKAAIKAAIEKAEKELQEKEKREKPKPTFRQLGIVGELGRAVSWVGRLIFGEKKNERKEKAEKRKVDYARILAKIGQAPVMSVYIVSDRYITLTFGGVPNNEGGISFMPYTIPIGIHNVEVGVSLQMKIDDIHAFATNYLADNRSVTIAMIQQMLNGSIETLLRQYLRNANYDQSGLSLDMVNALKLQIIQTINQQVYGISCTQVLSITDNNQDFERFRSVERELYNTEKELDYMHRTGEFRNRMENEANTQLIQSAQNAEQLRYALQQINKDQLLHDDELEEFTLLLQSQARIRNAKTETEEFEALEDIRKNRLVKQDEMEALEDALQHNKIPREEVTQIMRINSQLNIDTARMHAEWALNDTRTEHDWERQDLERRRNWGIEDEARERAWMQEEQEYNRDFARDEQEYNRDFDRKVREDDYDFQQMMRERELKKEDEQLSFERERQNKFDEDQLDANRSQRQIEKLQAMAQMQAQMDAQKYQHEENIATLNANERINRDNNFTQMTAEQIRAAQLDRLSESGQVAMGNAYGSEKEAEFMRQQVERQRQDAQRDKSEMMNFAKEMASMVRDTAASVNSAQQQQINTLQQQNQMQQQRYDHAQETAMNNLAQVSTAAASNINAFSHAAPAQKQAEMVECHCYNCGRTIRIPVGAGQCPECGAPFQW